MKKNVIRTASFICAILVCTVQFLAMSGSAYSTEWKAKIEDKLTVTTSGYYYFQIDLVETVPEEDDIYLDVSLAFGVK